YEWDWSGAEEEFRRAIEINPNSSIAHQRFGLYFNLLGRFEEARRELKLALEIDPLSPQIGCGFAVTSYLSRNYEKALIEIRRALEIDEDHPPNLYFLGRVYEAMGQADQAIATFEKLLASNNIPLFLGELGRAYAISGNHSEARRVLAELDQQSKQRYVSAY